MSQAGQAKGTGCELVIQNENLAAWMTINNTFAIKQGRRQHEQWKREDYRVGLLIQLGQFEEFPDGTLMEGPLEVLLQNGVEEKQIIREEFEGNTVWINLIQQKTNPMTKDDLRNLLLEKPATLHQYLRPYKGGITAWPDNGFELSVVPDLNDPERLHRSFTFKWPGATSVEVFKNGMRWQDKGMNNVQRVTIVKNPGGIHQDPPQRP